MKTTVKFAIALVVLLAGTMVSAGQTWNSNAGGYNTGYGTVYGSFGLAQATQNIYNTMQMNMQRSMMRSAMIKKWGLAAVEKAEREASASRGTAAKKPATGPVVQPRPAAKNYGKFRPDATVDTGKAIADALGTTPEEKALYKAIFQGTKTAFEGQAAAKGWKNDIAGALTFFLVTTSTIYHDAPEPDDEKLAAIYDAVNQSIDEVPEFAAAANKDKQAIYNLFIGFAGIPLATYSEGKDNNSAETINVARQLSGELIKIVLKTDPEKIRLDGSAK